MSEGFFRSGAAATAVLPPPLVPLSPRIPLTCPAASLVPLAPSVPTDCCCCCSFVKDILNGDDSTEIRVSLQEVLADAAGKDYKDE